MSDIAAISAAAFTAAPIAAPAASAVPATQVERAAERTTAPAIPALDVTVYNTAAEAAVLAAAMYDNRGVGVDDTPRGVDIDRIKMIVSGFEHMRTMFAPAYVDAGASTVDISL